MLKTCVSTIGQFRATASIDCQIGTGLENQQRLATAIPKSIIQCSLKSWFILETDV